MRQPEPIIDKIKNVLLTCHSNLIKDDVKVERIWLSKAYKITSGKSMFIMKVYPEPEVANSGEHKWWKSIVEKQIWIAKNIDSNVPIPTILDSGYFESSGVPDGNSKRRLESRYILYTHLDYEISSVLDHIRPDPETDRRLFLPGFFDDQQGPALLRQIGSVSRSIHQTKTDGFGRNWGGFADFAPESESFLHKTWSAMVAANVNESGLNVLLEDGLITNGELNSLLGIFDLLAMQKYEPRLFHEDLVCNFCNVLVEKNSQKIKGVIDWDPAGAGPAPVFEFGGIYCEWILQGIPLAEIERLFVHVVEGYGLTWRQYNDEYKEQVRWAMLLITIHAFYYRSKRDPGNKGKEHVYLKNMLSAVL